jgi:hypothetical protein
MKVARKAYARVMTRQKGVQRSKTKKSQRRGKKGMQRVLPKPNTEGKDVVLERYPPRLSLGYGSLRSSHTEGRVLLGRA